MLPSKSLLSPMHHSTASRSATERHLESRASASSDDLERVREEETDVKGAAREAGAGVGRAPQGAERAEPGARGLMLQVGSYALGSPRPAERAGRVRSRFEVRRGRHESYCAKGYV